MLRKRGSTIKAKNYTSERKFLDGKAAAEPGATRIETNCLENRHGRVCGIEDYREEDCIMHMQEM